MEADQIKADDAAVDIVRSLLAAADIDPDRCHEWDGSVTREGYGRLWVGGRKGRVYLAHRLSMCVKENYQLEEIDGWLVRHMCNNRLCYNPHHLLLGDDKQNVLDRIYSGRSGGAKGERNGRTRLTDEQVEEIRALHEKGWKNVAIAKEFGVSAAHIGRLVTYRQRV